MFKSYENRYNLDYDYEVKLYRFEYKIIDSEFSEIGESCCYGRDYFCEVGAGVIDMYEKLNLPVAYNLCLVFIWVNKAYIGYEISGIISWNKMFNPKFAKYEKDVNKYLILI